jgi:hypothetical protein
MHVWPKFLILKKEAYDIILLSFYPSVSFHFCISTTEFLA